MLPDAIRAINGSSISSSLEGDIFFFSPLVIFILLRAYFYGGSFFPVGALLHLCTMVSDT